MEKEKLEKIKKLRELTNLPLGECKELLEKANFDFEKAKELAKDIVKEFLKGKEKELKAGTIAVYLHPNNKIGAMVEISCESDFVAQNIEFQRLAKEICLQVAASPSEEPLLEQKWIKDESLKIKDLILKYSKSFGEVIEIKRFVRYQVGE